MDYSNYDLNSLNLTALSQKIGVPVADLEKAAALQKANKPLMEKVKDKYFDTANKAVDYYAPNDNPNWTRIGITTAGIGGVSYLLYKYFSKKKR